MKKAFPLFVLTLYCIFCMVMTPTQASAYIDPSTTTFIIQAGIGLVVAIAAGFSIYWRKAKRMPGQLKNWQRLRIWILGTLCKL